ncbi:1457_t:CDS:2 [Funneliformis geosporum]|uniref:4572_t:CDS:1 n=1 Tax=Funneliformis geosporum TaxID=1117311 RepID=A0A9W4SGV3_9GLOM|nr:1457_t:CDS:2 [Funneliformis geosporum]CAI2167986.1 4572_t:CDS:2 [Funneliformis geosporum]
MSLFILDDMIADESESHDNKRVKITTACDTCRRRKVKCDGASPCANCTRGAYSCTFSDASTKRPRGPPKGFVALIEDRLHTIESLLVNLVNKDSINETNKRERESSTNEESNQRQRFSTFKVRQYSPTNAIAPATLSSPRLFIPTTPPADANYISDHSTNLIPGFSDDLGSDDEDILLHNLIAPNPSNSLHAGSFAFLIPNNQQNVVGGSYVDPPLPSIISQFSEPPSHISKNLLERYFNHFHPYFPIINRGQFFKMMSCPNVEDRPSPLLLNAIYAIGAMFPPTLQDFHSSIFYDRSKNLLDNFIDVPRLSTVQALILLCMVDQGKPSSYRPQTYSSVAIRMALSMGLNRRNGAVYQGKGRHTKKLVWWGCFILDRLNSLANGDPLTINDKMCDIEFPSPDEVDDLDDDNLAQPQCHSSQQDSLRQSTSPTYSSSYAQQTNIFVSFARLARIIGQIIEHLQSTSCIGIPASWTHHAMVNSFEVSLLNWLRELPPFLQYAPSPHDMPLPGHIASLHMHHQTLFLMLHYPYIVSHNARSPHARMSKIFIKSLNACSKAASVITHIGGKAAKVHVINLVSPHRGVAINAYRNVVKTIKICRYYEQNNIMTELASHTIASLESVLMSHQDKFSNEEAIEISSVSPAIAVSSSLTSPTHIKISPTMANQMFHTGSKQMQPDLKRDVSSTNIQQHTSNFTFVQNQGGPGMQQYMPVNQIFDSFAMQMQPPMMMTSSEPYWDLGMDLSGQSNMVGGYNNHSYNNITPTIPLPTASSTTSTPALSTTTTVQQQRQRSPQRQISLPVSSPIPIYAAAQSNETQSRSSQMSLNSIEQDNGSGSNMMNENMSNVELQNIHPSQRYVFTGINGNNSSIANANGNGGFVIEGENFYGHLSDSNETYQRIFNKIPGRMIKKEDEDEAGQVIANGNDSPNKDAISVLSRRLSGHCCVTPSFNDLKFGGSFGSNRNGNDYSSSPIGIGLENNHCHIDGNGYNNSREMKEVNVGFHIGHY